MQNQDENSRGNGPLPGHRPHSPNKYQENRYGSRGNYNANFNANSNSYQNQQHPRRRTDRFKRETLNINERILRQNDLIIRLLKEIRDRLPPHPGGIAHDGDQDPADQAQISNDAGDAEKGTCTE